MCKKIFFLLVVLLSANAAIGQESETPEPFYVNLFISADKTIYVENERTGFEQVDEKVTEIVRNKPFKLDQKIVYRIFADENLKLGYIMDVNQQMLSGYGESVQTLKYLLDTSELNPDGQKWFQSIDMKQLKSLN